MLTDNTSDADIISTIVKKVAVYDIRNWGPYPETKGGFRRAAVLLPITVHNGEVLILLTKRSKNLRSHPSAVAFPGGVRDETDPSDIATALREAEEEIGLPPECVQILGVLTRGVTLPNTVVYPIVGLIPNDFIPKPNPTEVEFAFFMPLKDFVNKEKMNYRTVRIGGRPHLMRSLTYCDGEKSVQVYGFTASYCILLAHIVFDDVDNMSEFSDTKETKGLYDELVKYFEYVTSLAKTKAKL